LRKLFAILLLALLLFNIVGYRLFFSYLESNAQSQMSAAIDSNAYQPSDLFEIKVPLNMPYASVSNSFERYDGSIEIKGLHYNYVERKVQNDTLVLVCIQNKAQNLLTVAKDKYAATEGSYQMPSGKNNTASLVLGFLVGVCHHQNISYQFSCMNCVAKLPRAFNIDGSCSAYHLSPEQPPETI
jgi:hypothetical protein